MIVTVYGQKVECSRAEKGADFVRLYDERGGLIFECSGVLDFAGYEVFGGSWETTESGQGIDGRLLALEESKADRGEVIAIWDQMAQAYSEGVQQA